mgnify:CR=1 FL=1
MKHFSLFFTLLILYSCSQSLSNEKSEREYKEEFHSTSKEVIHKLSEQYFATRLEYVDFSINRENTLSGQAQKTNFDGHNAVLHYSFYFTSKNNTYSLILRQLHKMVPETDHHSGNTRMVRKEVTEYDENDMNRFFKRLNSDLYAYIKANR